MIETRSLVYTTENCVGCNKCIKACNCVGACVSVEREDISGFRIEVDSDRCIACGACIDVCIHNARKYTDDTERFFNDLKRGDDISVLVAPAFKANYPDEYDSVLGGLKKLGVKHFINVAFGADIATWACVKHIKEFGNRGGISQPCPVVVNYIEMYHPELMQMLMPIQSPLICAATYARLELGISGKFAFISPCIGKKVEIDDPNTKGYVSYNVTFKNLMEYVHENYIKGDPVTEDIDYGLGAFYPAPGGLKDYVTWLLGETTFIKQISGPEFLYDYLDKNADLIKEKHTPFLFIDALNCEDGCLCGTATDPVIARTDKALYTVLNIRENIKNNDKDSAFSRDLTPQQRWTILNERFSNLKLEDYERKYTNKSYMCSIREPNYMELQSVFMEMHKYSEESKHIDCSYCGYNSCKEMATAIFNGFNQKENCVHYLKAIVEDEQEMLKYRADHDEFLDIWNRRAAIDALHKRVADDEKYSIIIIDLDNYKGINETYGTAIGDQLLVKLAWELKQLALSRKWILGRYAGDEFLMIIPGVTLDEESELLQDIQYVIGTPISVGQEIVSLSASLGVANSDNECSAEELMVLAEYAKCEAKTKGRNTVSVYSEELQKQAHEEARIKEKLKEAFDNDGFFMVYQPQVDSKTKKVCGYEALVRMKEPGIYPGQFIPVAEKNGWIWRIGRITTSLVIRQLSRWRAQGHEIVPVSINFSSNQLNDREYVEFLENLLREYDIPAKYVEIEITEGLFLRRSDQAAALFKKFKDMGIRLLMDDFGTGYSSLGYLTYIPVDVIKLDKSLVDTYLVDGKDLFIKDVIRLMHDLDKSMIIEGVEEKWQYERLCEFEADVIQGYYFSRPLPEDEAITFKVTEQ